MKLKKEKKKEEDKLSERKKINDEEKKKENEENKIEKKEIEQEKITNTCKNEIINGLDPKNSNGNDKFENGNINSDGNFLNIEINKI